MKTRTSKKARASVIRLGTRLSSVLMPVGKAASKYPRSVLARCRTKAAPEITGSYSFVTALRFRCRMLSYSFNFSRVVCTCKVKSDIASRQTYIPLPCSCVWWHLGVGWHLKVQGLSLTSWNYCLYSGHLYL